MSASIEHVLEAFRQLTPDEQREAASLILRGVANADYPPLDDEALARIADRSFREYDAREAGRDRA